MSQKLQLESLRLDACVHFISPVLVLALCLESIKDGALVLD